jgi:predicted lipid-binding transport protein (Tim44 family)
MTRGKRALLLLAAAALLTLIAVPVAQAAAGGGSAGFGGGGGGHGGRGAGLYILFQILIRIAIFGHGLGVLIIIGLIVLALVFTNLAPRVRSFWSATQSQGPAARRRSAHRERRVELAAAEAADEDPAFAPDAVKPAASRLFTDIQAAWDANDRVRLRGLVAPELMTEWNQRLDDFERRGWRNRSEPIGEPTVEYVGLTNRGDEQSHRVVVRLEAKLRDYVEDGRGNHIKRAGRLSETIRIREFWTLTRRDNKWILASIEQGAEGAHALEDQIVPTAWSDDESLRDETLVEQAMADALPDDVKPAEVADLEFDGDARVAALDLSLADGRFAPDILEIAARRAVAAWATAIDGDDGALKEIASAAAAEALLHPAGQSSRLVVRGPKIKQIRITGLDAAAEPPTMTIDVELTGRRYLEDRATTEVLQGSSSRQSAFTEHWTMALEGDARQPWRIVGAGAPAALA